MHVMTFTDLNIHVHLYELTNSKIAPFKMANMKVHANINMRALKDEGGGNEHRIIQLSHQQHLSIDDKSRKACGGEEKD